MLYKKLRIEFVALLGWLFVYNDDALLQKFVWFLLQTRV